MSNLSGSSSSAPSPPSAMKASTSSAGLGSSGSQSTKFCTTDSYQVMSEKTNSSWQKNSNLRDNARLLHKHTQKLYEHSLEQTTIEVQLSESYTNYSVGVEDQTSAFGELMRKFGETLKDTGATRQKMLDHVSKDFLQPLSNCIEYDFGQVRHARDKVKKSVKDYDVALDQFQSVFRDGNLLNRNKLTQLEKELGQLHEVIVQNTNDFFEKTTTLERKKDTKVMRTLLGGMKAYCDFYQKTAELYARIAPQIESFEKQLSDLEKGTHVKPTKEGHLLAKRSKGWNKEYFELRDGLLYKISKSDKTVDPENSISMQLSTVKLGPPKDSKDKGKEKLCFQVINPLQKKPLVLQAATVEERDEWVAVLEQAISTYLDLGDANSQRSDDNPIAEKILRIVRTVPGNTVCCDCATESPTWVSINLGMVMCLECSGVHRSLGSHISKVRSLTLDKWDPEMIVYLAMIGNTKGNEFFLKEMPEDFQKLNPKSDRTSREKLITAKYKDRLFLPTNLEEYMVTKDSFDTTDEKENFAGVFKLLVFLFCNKETSFDLLSGSTLLIESAKTNNWLYIQALIACGVNLYSQDASGRTAFHYAAEANFFQSLNVLCRAASKDVDPNRFRDLKGETPLEIALAKGNLESAALLSGRVAALSPQDPSYMTVLNKMLEISEQQYQQTSLEGHEAALEGQTSASASDDSERMNGKTVPNCIVDQYAIVVETLNKNLVDSLHSYPLDLMFDDVLDFGDSLESSSSSEASSSEGDLHRALQTSSSTGSIAASSGTTEALKKIDFLAPPRETENPLASNSWSSSTTKAFLSSRPVLSPHISNSNLTSNPHRHSFSPSTSGSGITSRSHSVDETNKPIRRRRTQTSTLSDSLFDSGSEARPFLEVDLIDSSSGGDSGEEGDSSSVSPTLTKQKRAKTHSFNSIPNKDLIGPDGDAAAPGMVMDQMAVWRRSSNETPVDPNAPSDDGKKNKFAFVKRLATRKSEEKKIKRKTLLPGTPALYASTGSSAAASSTPAISSPAGAAFPKPPLTTQTSAVENYDHLDPEYLINTSSLKVLASITNNSLHSSSSGPGNQGPGGSGATTTRQSSGIECFGNALTSANVLPRSAESAFVETDWFLPDRFVEIAGDFEIPLDSPPPPPTSPRAPLPTSPRIPPPTPPRPNLSSPSSPDQ